MRYFRRTECGQPEEISLHGFIKGIQDEFMYGEDYYEYAFVMLGMGYAQIGSKHMYWIEDERIEKRDVFDR